MDTPGQGRVAGASGLMTQLAQLMGESCHRPARRIQRPLWSSHRAPQ